MQILCVDTFSTERYSIAGMNKQNWVSFAQNREMEVKSVFKACFYAFRLYICSYFGLMEIANKKTIHC